MTKKAWMLPDQISDVLPRQAATLETLRRGLLDLYQQYGYELVMPPLVEYTDALLDSVDEDLNLRTVKWADAVTGRTLAVRTDMTPQVARIDAHLLNRSGVARLAYFGSVFHARANGLLVSREPLQMGAEIYGHAGLEADVEVLTLLLASLRFCRVPELRVDVSHAGIVQALLVRDPQLKVRSDSIFIALQAKDAVALSELTAGCDEVIRQALLSLLDLYGGVDVLARARAVLPQDATIRAALNELSALADLEFTGELQFDLADLTGYLYHTGIMFTAYCKGAPSAIARGGRYDHIGERFGRTRPATGFSLDLREVTELLSFEQPKPAILAPWSMDVGLRVAVAALRGSGEFVVQIPPLQVCELDAFVCDRELVFVSGVWQVKKRS